MIRFNGGFRLALVLFLAFAVAAKADNPPAKPAALASLESMVGNLGYKTTDAADNQAFSITWDGKYNYIVHFDLSHDGTLGYAYIDLTTFKPEQVAKLQFVKLLEASDVSDFYFSMENNTDGETLYANAILPLDGLTPESLRSTLDSWINKVDSSDALWNPDLWK